MKTLIAIIAFGLFCPNIYSQGSWTIQSSGTTANLNSVFFTDSNSGYAVGELGTIIKTTNGGVSWEGSSSKNNTINFSFVSAYNQNAIYAGGRDYSMNITAPSACVFESNGNLFTTVLTTSGSNQGLYSIYCTDVNTCYASGSSAIFKTVTAGSNWSQQTNAIIASNSLFSIVCTNPNVCYAAGTGIIIKTIDGGINWTSRYNSSTANLRSLFFTDSSTGYVVGDSSVILKTINGGTNWNSLSFPVSKQILTSVFFINTATGFIVGNNGIIYRTDNGGTTWIQQQSGTTNNLNSIFFPTATTGYAVGNGGVILKLFAPTTAINQYPLLRSSNSLTQTGGILTKTASSDHSWMQLFVNGVRNFIKNTNF